MDTSAAKEQTTASTSASTADTNATGEPKTTETAQKDDYTPQDIHVNMAKVTNVSKHKTMSYFGANAQATTRSDMNALKSRFDKYAEERHFEAAPPGYYDYIIYPHRQDAYNMADPTKILSSSSESDDSLVSGDINRILRIGDFFAVIPPEFITVTTRSTDKSVQPLRQAGSIKTENGYSKKDIQISLILNGMDQINGYKVEGPMDYSYYVDGLRNLIAQMKFTPFMPIENTVVNITHGVNNVAIRNIYVETIAGFPEALQVVLTLDEFNVTPYLRIPNAFFDNSIDWDLFRWYTQKPLTDSSEVDSDFPEKLHAITTSALTNDFKFSIFKEEKIKDDSKSKSTTNYYDYTNKNNTIIDPNIHGNIYDESSYTEFISSDDDITLVKMSFSMGNIMPSIQLSYHEAPTMQFLGGTDTEYSFIFQTSDSYIAGKFNELNTQNKQTIRSNKYTNGLGFLRIDNELVQLTGINCVVINDIKVETIPNFPGLYSIAVLCVSYNFSQTKAEELKVLRPFGKNDKGEIREGTRADLISMEPLGFLNKVSQDIEIMSRFQELELYPDMHLPKYEEADDAISKIRAFREKNNLLEMPMYTKYPRHKTILPDSTVETEYEGYLDPDFYVMSLVSYSDITINNTDKLKASDISNAFSSNSKNPMEELMNKVSDPTDLFITPKITPDAATEPDYAYGYETLKLNNHHGFLAQWENKGEENLKNSQKSDIQLSTGTSIQGSGITMPSKVNKKTGNVFIDLLCDRIDAKCKYKWSAAGELYDGVQSFDCSGFVSWGLMAIGAIKSRLTTYDLVNVGIAIDESELKLGDFMVRHGGDEHTAAYLGNGKTCEAASTDTGLIYGNVGKRFNRYRRIPNMAELNEAFLKAHPDFYAESGDSSSSSSSTESATSTTTTSGAASTASTSSSSTTSGIGTTQTIDASFNFASQDLKLKTVCTADQLNAFILIQRPKNNTPMCGQGASIIEASNQTGYDPVYLMAHAGWESGWGDSPINGKNNFYGMGADNNNPTKDAWSYATPEEGFIQCAKDIERQWYSGHNQRTLIEMVDSSHEYCGDTEAGKMAWVQGISSIMKDFHKHFNCWTMTNSGNLSTSSSGGSIPIDTTNPYGYKLAMYKNPHAGAKHGDKLSSIDRNKYGTDFVEKILDFNVGQFDYSKIGESTKQANDKDHVVEYMYRDSVQYNLGGLLARAFPSYLLVFLDDQADWVDRKKLWTNYYVSRAATDINIHESDDNPIAVAQVSLTNYNGNLSSDKVAKSISTVGFDDGEWIRKFMFEATGTIFDEEITDKMIQMRNTLYDEINLGEGTRVHIRLGYGSDPSRYPTCFNGRITEVSTEEIVTFIAESDGCELMNEPLTDKTEATNKDLGLGVEVSNIMADLLVARESGFLYTFSHGFFKYKSRYGIEHFGSHINEIKGEIGTASISSGEKITFSAAAMTNIVDGSMYYKQYDIIKNIYTGTYDGVPFCKNPYNPADGEFNFRFFCSGKTPWDVMKMCEKAVPEFVAYPRYFGFESRMFYGLPIWLCNYDYVKGKDGIYERAKSFAQVHEITSLDNIISSDIKLNSKNHNTNYIGIYSLGGDLSSTPSIMSDRNIDWSKQSTKVVDTTSVQDFSWMPGIIDKLLSWTGMYDNGKQLAINVCVSELMKSWKNTYDGSVIVLGQPQIKAYDYIYMNDEYTKLSGLFTVRGVTHSLSVDSGFITTITPGVIANNTLKKSGMSNVISSMIANSKSKVILSTILSASLMHFTKGEHGVKFTKLANMFLNKKNFVNGLGKTMFNYIKSTKILTNTAEYLEELNTVKKAVTVFKDVKEVATLVSSSAEVVAGTVFPPSIIMMIALDIIINIGLTWLYDMFAYRNCINLSPLYSLRQDGKTYPFCASATGQKTLLPGSPVSEKGTDLPGEEAGGK
ncbi:glucosaminidase domain-containing protein [Clostridium sp. YIM B02555]|uniref:glucosaminidase domain-containing protein n=1 Tax=Clostridium sp. YIM B02555 TaxID=2911968 RepID=UPI001EEE1056|nr:glucosaminidase domain-containing protein [Clostridium sp. YIM B02555]